MTRLIALAIAVAATLPASGKDVLPFIENDFAKAVARATTKSDPIFVEAWAPW
jgi:hypothetical protein